MFIKSLLRKSLGSIFCFLHNHFINNNLTVFLYHDIIYNPSEFSRIFGLNVTPNVFEQQIGFIKNHFNIISPDDLLEDNLPPKAALISFDDGFKSYFKNAIPILERYKIPSIIFLNMEPIMGGIFWSGLITYLCLKRDDFVEFLKARLDSQDLKAPLYLNCSREVVEFYLKNSSKNIEGDVSKFVGDFASLEDLKSIAQNNNVFFGNHLFNHEVPLLMSDEDFLNSYFMNQNMLKKYSNYREMFSFPFGQPNTTYSANQINLLLGKNVRKIFSSYPLINTEASLPYLHRVTLNSLHNSLSEIYFHILRNDLNHRFRSTT